MPGRGNSVAEPLGVMRNTLEDPISRNQRLPSGPAATENEPAGPAIALTAPEGVTRKTLPPRPATQRLPSGPRTTLPSPRSVGTVNRVIAPAGGRAAVVEVVGGGGGALVVDDGAVVGVVEIEVEVDVTSAMVALAGGSVG